jgi:hypothetical protein
VFPTKLGYRLLGGPDHASVDVGKSAPNGRHRFVLLVLTGVLNFPEVESLGWREASSAVGELLVQKNTKGGMSSMRSVAIFKLPLGIHSIIGQRKRSKQVVIATPAPQA